MTKLRNNPSGIILASGSERRKYLLAEMGLDFVQIPSSVFESGKETYYADAATLNAVRKAQDIAALYPDSLVIGADTVIEYRQEIIGKPADIAEAESILLRLSGNSHCVVSAVSLQSINARIRCTFAVSTKVNFKEITTAAVREYRSLVNVLDKAGAYAIQEYGEMLVESIEGPLDNVIGLPCKALGEVLEAVNSAGGDKFD
ncbi:MAG: Maf family protein [Victivallales bacterium]|jgi:septum formation protein